MVWRGYNFSTKRSDFISNVRACFLVFAQNAENPSCGPEYEQHIIYLEYETIVKRVVVTLPSIVDRILIIRALSAVSVNVSQTM